MAAKNALKLGLRLIPVVVLAFSGLLVSAASAGASTQPNWNSGHPYYCSRGNIPSGSYSSIVVTGVCYMPSGTVNVWGNLSIAPGALLDAVTPGDPLPPATPVVPATVLVGGNVFVGTGAALILGCSPNILCTNPPGITYDRVNGSISAFGALGVVLHSASIGGNVTIDGGGGGTNCNSSPAKPPSSPAPAPWSHDASLDYTPVYSDFEDVSVGGNLSISNLDSCWLGSLRDQVRGSATFVNNTMADPDAMEVANNLIGGNMACFNNTPGTPPPPATPSTGVQFGDSGAAPNIVGGAGLGECGFNVLQPNPPPEAGEGKGILEHIAVPEWSLRTYYGSRTQSGPSVKAETFGVTESGDTLAAEVNNVVLSGSGITGTLTANLSKPLGSTGEAVVSTQYPNGSQSFTAFDTCAKCSFDGKSGSVTIRAYGTTSANGVTYGNFLVTSGGTGNGGLSTLAGYGTFSSWGEPEGTLGLVEHLGLTGQSTPPCGRNPNPWSRAYPRR